MEPGEVRDTAAEVPRHMIWSHAPVPAPQAATFSAQPAPRQPAPRPPAPQPLRHDCRSESKQLSRKAKFLFKLQDEGFARKVAKQQHSREARKADARDREADARDRELSARAAQLDAREAAAKEKAAEVAAQHHRQDRMAALRQEQLRQERRAVADKERALQLAEEKRVADAKEAEEEKRRAAVRERNDAERTRPPGDRTRDLRTCLYLRRSYPVCAGEAEVHAMRGETRRLAAEYHHQERERQRAAKEDEDKEVCRRVIYRIVLQLEVAAKKTATLERAAYARLGGAHVWGSRPLPDDAPEDGAALLEALGACD